MDKDLTTLKEVQGWDKQIYSLRDELENIPTFLSESARSLEEEKNRLKQVEEELKNLQLKQKTKEMELGTKEENVKKLQAQQSQVKTNKEYSALQNEIISHKADASLLEEGILEAMDQVQSAHQKVQDQKKKAAEKEAIHQVKVKELEEKSKAIHQEIDVLKKQREGKIKEVDREIASLYDRIIEKKRGMAFVKVEGETCTACQMRLRPQILNEVMGKEKVVLCENCSRILYIE